MGSKHLRSHLNFSEKCIIFNPEENATARFIMELKDQFRCKTPELCSQVSMKTLYTDYNIGNMKDQEFEFIVLESALENIINKFKKLNFPFPSLFLY